MPIRVKTSIFLDDAVNKALRQLALDKDTSVQQILESCAVAIAGGASLPAGAGNPPQEITSVLTKGDVAESADRKDSTPEVKSVQIDTELQRLLDEIRSAGEKIIQNVEKFAEHREISKHAQGGPAQPKKNTARDLKGALEQVRADKRRAGQLGAAPKEGPTAPGKGTKGNPGSAASGGKA